MFRLKLVVDWHNYTFSVIRAQLEDACLPKVVDKSNHMSVYFNFAISFYIRTVCIKVKCCLFLKNLLLC